MVFLQKAVLFGYILFLEIPFKCPFKAIQSCALAVGGKCRELFALSAELA